MTTSNAGAGRPPTDAETIAAALEACDAAAAPLGPRIPAAARMALTDPGCSYSERYKAAVRREAARHPVLAEMLAGTARPATADPVDILRGILGARQDAPDDATVHLTMGTLRAAFARLMGGAR